jgi:hypothetical protein
MATRTNIIGTVSGIFSSARLRSRSAECRFRPFGFISCSRFMELKRLGCGGTIDILDRESNKSIAAMEEEANNERMPKKVNGLQTSQ